MKPIIIVLFLLIFSNTTFAQTPFSDSLRLELTKKHSQIDSLNKVINRMIGEKSDQKESKTNFEDIEKMKNDIFYVKSELESTKYNLLLSHKQFRTGTILKVVGIAAVLVGTVALSSAANSRGRSDNAQLPIFLYLCGTMSWTVGVVMCLDSHKYIGWAGKKQRSEVK